MTWSKDYTEGIPFILIKFSFRTAVISKKAHENDFKNHVKYRDNIRKASAAPPTMIGKPPLV